MESGILSLKWNNHKSAFFDVLSNIRNKTDNYADATLVCDGKFYAVHKLVLSSCSEYFEEIFEQAGKAQCKHPFIVLKDIQCYNLEYLLSYMYFGEVNVMQERLSDLIKAAECLRIKGLAVPDEESNIFSGEKRSSDNNSNSDSKRRKKQNDNEVKIDSLHFSRQVVDKNCENVDGPQLCSTATAVLDGSGIRDKIIEDTIPDEFEIKTEMMVDETDEGHCKAEPVDLDNLLLSTSLSTNKEFSEDFVERDSIEQSVDELPQESFCSLLENEKGGESCSPVTAGTSRPMMIPANWLRNCKTIKNQKNQSPPPDVKPFDEIVDTCKLYNDVLKVMYKCPVCEKVVKDRKDFRRHYRKHSGEKPYCCDICPFRAAMGSNIKNHMLKIHGVVRK